MVKTHSRYNLLHLIKLLLRTTLIFVVESMKFFVDLKFPVYLHPTLKLKAVTCVCVRCVQRVFIKINKQNFFLLNPHGTLPFEPSRSHFYTVLMYFFSKVLHPFDDEWMTQDQLIRKILSFVFRRLSPELERSKEKINSEIIPQSVLTNMWVRPPGITNIQCCLLFHTLTICHT